MGDGILPPADSSAPDDATKEDVAAVLAEAFGSASLSDGKRHKLETVAFTVLDKMGEDVRLALAREFAQVARLSQDLGKTLAADEAEAVAAAFIAETEIFTDAEWAEMLGDLKGHGVKAVAQRETVTRTLAEAIVASGVRDAVIAVAENEAAELTPEIVETMLKSFGLDAGVVTALSLRRNLSKSAALRVNQARKVLQQHLKAQEARHGQKQQQATEDVIERTRQRGLSPNDIRPEDVDTSKEEALLAKLGSLQPDTIPDFVQRMHAGGRLTDIFLLAIAKSGEKSLLELAFSARTRSDVSLVRARLFAGRSETLDDLFQRAKVAEPARPVLQKAVRALAA